MRVLHICGIATGRVLKEVLAFQGSITTGLLHSGCGHTDLMGWVCNSDFWESKEQLIAKVGAASSRYDVLHVHTSTNNSTLLELVSSNSNLPIVWDMHDTPAHMPDASRASHIVVPSDGYHKGSNYTTVYSMLPMKLFPEMPERRLDAGVLVSGIGIDPVYRDYREVQLSLSSELFIYPAQMEMSMRKHYSNLMQQTTYIRMMSEIGKFTFGYAGAANSGHSIHDCVTNKFWEYVAAGLPIVTYRSDEMSELVDNMWYGKKMEHLSDEISVDKVSKASQARFQFTMESQLPAMLEIYKEALC